MNQARYTYTERRLLLSGFGRLFIRFATLCGYAAIVAIAVILLAATTPSLQASGILLGLFLVHRLVGFRHADRNVARAGHGTIHIEQFVRPRSYGVVERAYEKSLRHGGSVEVWMLCELLALTQIDRVFERLDIDVRLARSVVRDALKADTTEYTKEELRAVIARVMERAYSEATQHYAREIDVHHILSALHVADDKTLARLYSAWGVTSEDIAFASVAALSPRKKMAGFLHARHTTRRRVMNRAWTAKPTPLLDSVSTDITDRAHRGEQSLLIGHQSEYDRLVHILSQSGSTRALLVGEPGSGKQTIVEHLAGEITKDRVPAPLYDKRLVELSIPRLTAGREPAQIQQLIQDIITEIQAAKNIIIYLPQIHELLQTGSGSISGADVLIAATLSGQLPIIGSTTPADAKKYIEQRSELNAYFEQIRVEPITIQDTLRYLVLRSLVIEHNQDVVVGYAAIKKAVELATRYFTDKPLPSSAEALIREAVATVTSGDKFVNALDVIRVAESKTNISLHAPAAAEAEMLLHLEETMSKRFVGQPEAVKAVSEALRQYRSGLARAGGPIATFLFVGPTGVGKTELAKLVSEIQFGSVEAMMRLDMSEYQSRESITRLLGSTTYQSSESLADAVRAKPFRLILLDEFEKAHPDILNIFLQVFDDGRLTDASGKTVDFKNTIIIATSNAHSELIKSEVEKGTAPAVLSELLKKRLTEYFKPELLNRFSGIIFFKGLTQPEIVRVTQLMLDELSAQLRDEQGLTLSCDQTTIEMIASLGYDPVYGARPLRAVIAEKIKAPLAHLILQGKVVRGGSLKVSYKDGFIFE